MQRHLGDGVLSDVTRLRRTRTTAGIVAVVAVVVLAALAIAARAGTSGVALAEPAAASPSTTAPPAATPTTARPATTPARPAAAPARVSAPAATPTTQPATTPTTVAAAPPIAPPALPADDTPPAPCALGLPVPEQTGGVASLIAIVPLFGPFTAEAFAMSPAWAPFLDVLGPSVGAFGEATEQAAPLLDVLIPPAQQLEEAGFEALDPLYGPYREQFLALQAELAAALAPGAEQLSTFPGTECLVALQALLFPPPAG